MGEKLDNRLKALSEVMNPPFQIVQQAAQNRWVFTLNHFPGEVSTDEEPPVQIGDDIECIPIDGCLGTYAPASQKITLFRLGIKRVAKILDLREADVQYVVRIHEWAHALLHIGFCESARLRILQDETCWPAELEVASNRYANIDDKLHERLAQLLTHDGIQSLRAASTLPQSKAALDRIADCFEKLTRRCPPDYHIHEYLAVPVPQERVLESIDLLKDRLLIGFEAWDKVVRW
ncbi:MAG: hypothetical protein IT365_14540 [Candidatus Hydrogenedentes bacterium]|nr:hypothetical protein [Candidatus Hydrogenedentota bacterium]